MHCRYTVSNTRLKCIHTLSHTLSALALRIRKLQFYHSNGLAAIVWAVNWILVPILELCWRADRILQFPNSALVYMALKRATYALLESTASKNIPHSCGPGKWQIGKWVTEYCVAITHCLRVWREEFCGNTNSMKYVQFLYWPKILNIC